MQPAGGGQGPGFEMPVAPAHHPGRADEEDNRWSRVDLEDDPHVAVGGRQLVQQRNKLPRPVRPEFQGTQVAPRADEDGICLGFIDQCAHHLAPRQENFPPSGAVVFQHQAGVGDVHHAAGILRLAPTLRARVVIARGEILDGRFPFPGRRTERAVRAGTRQPSEKQPWPAASQNGQRAARHLGHAV